MFNNKEEKEKNMFDLNGRSSYIEGKIKANIKILLRKDVRDELRRNMKFHNMHKGERCFILGNGPSLNDENLGLLNNECIFTVNQISRRKDYSCIRPSYHFWADQNFFNLDLTKSEDVELLNTMRSVKVGNDSPICFYPISQKGFVKSNGLNLDLDCHFFYSNYSLYDGFDGNINFSKSIPGGGTVIVWCIEMAIYMGFSEIYLLGCDNTGLVNTINSVAKSDKEVYSYGYTITDNEKKRLENLLKKHSLEVYVEQYLKTIIQYRVLYKYCLKRNINLINCSSTTAIDCIPRKSLESIING